MALLKELKLGKLYYEINRHNPPALTINPGETIKVETEDTFNGLVRKEGEGEALHAFDDPDLLTEPQVSPLPKVEPQHPARILPLACPCLRRPGE